MENFKITIKRRIILFSAITLIAVVLGVYDFFEMSNLGEGSLADGAVTGFQFGIIFGIGLLTLLQTIKLSMIIKDDKKLKILYNKEHDERLKMIRSKAGMPMLMVTSIIMLIAAVIAGYFNIVVFSTLVIAAFVQLSIGVIVKLYCMKTI